MTTPDHKAALDTAKFYQEHNWTEEKNLATCFLDLREKAKASLDTWKAYADAPLNEHIGVLTAMRETAEQADAALRAILEGK